MLPELTAALPLKKWRKSKFADQDAIFYYHKNTGEETILDTEGFQQHLPEIKDAARSISRHDPTHPVPFIVMSVKKKINPRNQISATRSTCEELRKACRFSLDTWNTFHDLGFGSLFLRHFKKNGKQLEFITFALTASHMSAAILFRVADGACITIIKSCTFLSQQNLATIKAQSPPHSPLCILSIFSHMIYFDILVRMRRLNVLMILMRRRLGLMASGNYDEMFDDETMLNKVYSLGTRANMTLDGLVPLLLFFDRHPQVTREWDRARSKAGLETGPSGERAWAEDGLANLERTCRKNKDMLTRVKEELGTMSSLIYGRIVQRDTRINMKIAAAAARDSQTMKTITVITLLFLPSTLIASIWVAGIFTIEGDANWKAFVGTTIAVTAAVFAAWLFWLRQRRETDGVLRGLKDLGDNNDKNSSSRSNPEVEDADGLAADSGGDADSQEEELDHYPPDPDMEKAGGFPLQSLVQRARGRVRLHRGEGDDTV